MWVTWGEPLAQEISSPGKTAVAAKLPRIYCHSSITEWPYFLGNIAVPQENLSHASYTSKWVKIQEPPKTVIRSYFKNTNAYTDCNTNPLVSCLGTCLSHQLIDHCCSSDIDVHQSTPRLSSKRIVLIFRDFQQYAGRSGCVILLLFQQGYLHTYLWTTKSTGSFPWKYGHSVVVEQQYPRKFHCSNNISWRRNFKNSPPFSCPFFQVACSLRSLATCYSLPDQRLLQHKLWLVQFRMVSENQTGILEWPKLL